MIKLICFSFLKKLFILKTALICFFGISMFFIFSSNLSDFVGKHLQVDSRFTGGEIANEFFDELDDDKGCEKYALRYPLHKSFSSNSLDLICYTVFQPVTNARWQENADYWQLMLEYKSGSAVVRNIMIYIDVDVITNGTEDTLFDFAEKVRFQKNHEWDFAIWICNNICNVYNSKKEFVSSAEYYAEENDAKIKVRVPLKNKQLQKVLGATKTYHYVLTGAYSPFDRGGFMPVSEKASMSRGGMKNANHYNTLVPSVYDVLGSNAALATWNAETFEHALLEPVEVCMKKKHERNQTEIERIVKQVKQDYENYMNELSQVSLRENAEAESALFFSRDVDERLSYYGKKLQANPDDYVSMSYYGAALAMKGGESSVFKAISLVNEAYKYLDAASRLAFGKDGEIDVLMNRACVSASVPNHVFEKAQSGAEDFIRIANLSDDERTKAYCYVMAYECYKICGKEDQAFLILQEAKKMIK